MNDHIKRKSGKNVLILKGIQVNILENEVKNILNEKYSSVTSVDRFKRKDGRLMSLMKVDLNNKEEYDNLLSNGIFIKHQYFAAEQYISVKKPNICRKCWQIGHFTDQCKNDRCCKICLSTDHFDNCNLNKKCINCNGSHLSNDINCPKYQDFLKKFNNISD